MEEGLALGDPPLPPDDLRCKRTDGRHWRCKRPSVDGKSFCLPHLHRRQKKPPPPTNPKPRVRIRIKPVKPEPIDTEFPSIPPPDPNQVPDPVPNPVVDTGPVPDHLRCNRNDGRSWRCKKRVLDGQTLCEAHFHKAKAQNQKKPIMRKKKQMEKKENGVVLENGMRNNGTHTLLKKKKEKELGRVGPGLDSVPDTNKRRKKLKSIDECNNNKKKNDNDNDNGNNVVVKVEKEMVEEAKEEEEKRCKRTDGRGWRCKRKVSEGKTLCEIHYEQGRLRQKRITVPEELKIQRGESGEKVERRLKRKKELEILESNSDNGMKRMKADLIRVFLRREIIERKKKSEKQRLRGGEDVGGGEGEEEVRDLPFGLMAIPPAPPTNQFLDNAGSLGIKVGVHRENSLVTRRFRSKNIEPTPIGSLKVVPYLGNVEKVKNSGRRKCHWCRKSDNLCLIKCSSCRKRYFCSNCVKERSADSEEVKLRCPVCRGSCDCKACCTARAKETGVKEVLKEKCKGSKFQRLQYLINFLLPILVQINQEQGIEVEMEAKFKGQNPFDVEIRQADVGCRDQCCCNNCKSPILDFHRSCPNCSYNLCLSCCREYAQVGSLGATYPNRTKTLFPRLAKCSEKSAHLASSAPLLDSTACLQISCPPMELGGCDNSLLDLRCIFPLNWTKELEISAKETTSEHDFLQNTDKSVHCSLCPSISQAGDRNKDLQEASRRKESSENFLYCPSTSDDHDCMLVHFQKHWRKGHPVKVRNVLQCVSALSWDPVAMFCGYLEKGFSNCKNSKDAIEAASCLDSYDVEFGTKESFSGSAEEGFTHKRCETLKVKAKISSAFSRKLLEGYYGEIINSLPLQEYTNPRMGLLNIAGKLPEDFPDSKLGPHVCISCGSREEVARGELVTKLGCNSYDVVNILVHVSDEPCSAEQLNKIKKLIKRNNNMKDKGCQDSDKDLEDEETRIHSEISVEVGEQHRAVGVSCCSAATNDASAINNLMDNKSSPAKPCSDTDSDASMICSRISHSPEKSVDQIPHLDHLGSPNITVKRPSSEPCGAQWDVFRRQDIPKLLEYIAKHVDELRFSTGFSNNVVHPLFDGNFYLDAVHKIKLKEEFDIEPWTFNQCLGEAVFIPAGCPYQIKNLKSCVSITLGFISPENASECIKLINEIRILPNNHKAKQVKLEVEKMVICSIDEAIKEIYRLMSEQGNH